MRVQCPNCSKVFPVTPKVAGRKAQCGCGTVLQMPQLSPAATPSNAAGKIQMTCGSCNRQLSVPANAAGKLVQCPCGVKSPVPNAGANPQPANDPFGSPSAGYDNDPFADDSFAGSGGFENDGFDSADSGDYGIASAPAYLNAPKPRPKAKKKKSTSSASADSGGPDYKQVLMGFGMMVGAVVWFVGALALGRIFFYPPILLIIGLVTMIKGLLSK